VRLCAGMEAGTCRVMVGEASAMDVVGDVEGLSSLMTYHSLLQLELRPARPDAGATISPQSHPLLVCRGCLTGGSNRDTGDVA